MAIKIVDAEDLGAQGIRLTADLDADPAHTAQQAQEAVAALPDADQARRLFTATFGSYAASKNANETEPSYRQRVKGELRGLAREERVRRGIGGAGAPGKIAGLIGDDIT